MKTLVNMYIRQRGRGIGSNSAPECITRTSPGGTWRIFRGWGKAPVLRYSRAHQRPSARSSRWIAVVEP
jgi:hypothetical protein